MSDTVTLEPADYWKLLKLGADLDVATIRARALLASATEARDQFAKTLAEKYPAFVVDGAHYRADDATCSLIREP
jgi:hypothetical protein